MILDTHTLLWMDRDDAALSPESRRQIEIAWRTGRVAVSAISFWEAAMLAERERITLPVPAERWRADWLQAGLIEIPLDGRIALLSCRLENFHRDPADRFIVATAIDRNVPLMTADQKILDWAGNLDRLDARGR
ncbi:MAG: type II toxin-antitoxin system VapC family toxin [Candidatus Nitricoxidivorans perseverans]|uniref:Type II toxin-antitoxin system VapC family toxin n=1 Tax=Candidatus Nitricoxidivorans perseverans TaxID=2975601 RepID=A0AA49IXK6_9PROT|nr:MAG: type II toxin-antitoxin system VapC family toxin [Candidatus Nitricoxidivorans perseverans]